MSNRFLPWAAIPLLIVACAPGRGMEQEEETGDVQSMPQCSVRGLLKCDGATVLSCDGSSFRTKTSCVAPQSCNGGGTANVCGCTPSGACKVGTNCGTVSDGCGGNGNYMIVEVKRGPRSGLGTNAAETHGETPSQERVVIAYSAAAKEFLFIGNRRE